MKVRDLALAVGGALLAAGGIYLFLEVRSSGATEPSAQAIAEAQARARATASRGDTSARPEPPEPSGDAEARPRPMRPRVARGLGSGSGEEPAAGSGDTMVAARFNVPGGTEAPVDDPVARDEQMLEANKAYDRHSYDDARTMALKLLDGDPKNVRMLRIVVSSSCILGDAEEAQKYWTQLPQFDREQMTTRCDRFGITFKE